MRCKKEKAAYNYVSEYNKHHVPGVLEAPGGYEEKWDYEKNE